MTFTLVVALALGAEIVLGQAGTAGQIAELAALKGQVGSPETRVRVGALHRVWSIGLAATEADVKIMALDLLLDPVGSSSDHIRMPAVYAIAEIAQSSSDARVKVRALTNLREPLQADQVPIRDVAIDAVNHITGSGSRTELAIPALQVLGPAVKSGNNGVRIPAINAVVRAVSGSRNERAYQTALDLLVDPLQSSAVIGGMEARMMAVVAVERIGVDAVDVPTKAKAMGLLQSYVSRSGWEPEAKTRAQSASERIQSTIK